jgi:hypothetical protein
MSYQFINSCRVWGSSRFFSRVLAMISRVSVTGMFVQRFVMSSEAREKWGSIGVSLSLLIRFVVFSSLYLLGSWASILIFWVNSPVSL